MLGVKLENLTYEEAEKIINEDSIVVLPLGGGSKEHAGHLPLGTDMFIAEWLADRVTERFPVITLPTLAYAHYPAFVTWKGSISLEAENFINLVREIFISFIRHGVKKFLIIDFGFSTFFPLVTVSTSLRSQYGARVAITRAGGLGVQAKREVLEQSRGGHACEHESSLMLYIDESLCHMEHAVEEYREQLPGTVKNRAERVYLSNRMETEHGVNGNATLATKEKGEKILHAMVDDIVRFLESFQKLDVRAG
jgi:creatinine amidohydrolase